MVLQEGLKLPGDIYIVSKDSKFWKFLSPVEEEYYQT